MIGVGAVWGFLGLPGLREMVLIALVALILYGRSGLQHHPYARLLRPWVSRPRRVPPTPPGRRTGSKLGDRAYWILAITAATAVAAWIVTRMLIAGAPGVSH